jgi:hypothetical protein
MKMVERLAWRGQNIILRQELYTAAAGNFMALHNVIPFSRR